MGAKRCMEKVKDTFSDLIKVPDGVFGFFSSFLFDQSPQWESEIREQYLVGF